MYTYITKNIHHQTMWCNRHRTKKEKNIEKQKDVEKDAEEV